MSRRRRRTKRRHKRKIAKGSRRRSPQKENTPQFSWHWYAVVIAVALILFAIFIATQFRPIDRLLMIGTSGICVGIAFLIIGACTAVGNFELNENSWFGKVLGYLVVLATPPSWSQRRSRLRSKLNRVSANILIPLVLPSGFCLSLLSPKQTWPAIAWTSGGLLATLAGTLFLMMTSR